MDILKKVLSYVNLKGLVVEWVMREVVKGKLDEIAKDSANPYDDAAVAFIYPLLEDAVSKALDKLEEKPVA